MSERERAYNLNKSTCSTPAAVRRRCGELSPSLHWNGFLRVARASRLYRPRPRARPTVTGTDSYRGCDLHHDLMIILCECPLTSLIT